LLQAFAINNKGRIVGYGLIHGQFHAFMLSLPRFQRANDMAERSNDGRAHSSSTPDLDPARLPDRKRIETLLGKQFILEMRGDSRIPLD